TNPETSLNDVWYVDVTEDSGDVVVFVRDTLPPGNDSDIRNTAYTSEFSSSYISDWRDDAASYSSERTTLVDTPREKILLPPMEPGKTYYLGVYANSDANFDFGVSTSGSPFVLDGIIDFAMDGVVNQAIAAGDSLYYRIDVPAGASRWLHRSVHSSNIEMRLQIGTIPDDGFHAWRSYGADSGFDRLLVDSYGMPNTGSYKHWRESETIYLEVVNSGAGEEQFSFTMNGQFLATEDMDEDGILDAYERYYFGATFYSATSDYDGDSLTLLEEFEAGTDPTNSDSDGDGISDGDEVAAGSDPNDATSVPTDDEVYDGLPVWIVPLIEIVRARASAP
ncbi:MAG: thrombospondin type 3 repeat-containing protein, partial [Luminiphilus sp.]|nr:thrombospondin type 3 repeat-containing protein [Luminiphilus sp.]